jgi:hypothetical protein
MNEQKCAHECCDNEAEFNDALCLHCRMWANLMAGKPGDSGCDCCKETT